MNVLRYSKRERQCVCVCAYETQGELISKHSLYITAMCVLLLNIVKNTVNSSNEISWVVYLVDN